MFTEVTSLHNQPKHMEDCNKNNMVPFFTARPSFRMFPLPVDPGGRQNRRKSPSVSTNSVYFPRQERPSGSTGQSPRRCSNVRLVSNCEADKAALPPPPGEHRLPPRFKGTEPRLSEPVLFKKNAQKQRHLAAWLFTFFPYNILIACS